MRPAFFEELYNQMLVNPNIYVLTGDLGYGGFDKIRNMFPERFINTGASEQALLDIAVGLALAGRIPFCYTITSFYLRAAETISLYLSHEQIAVHLIGSGRDQDYAHDGFSHDADVAQDVIGRMNIDGYYPDTKEQVPEIVQKMIASGKPSFLSLRR